ncbi:hypothetical protein PMG11_04631 [Penicillium brasilianum]|uniref:Uncharacterized protein n=1 Tax=Penicillium brasilianum TaxID=104259 RepID=A0A0F7VDD5_PENBI|nr:hypothetical protein PMG11_04631 [Penicillium brasilianum]
MGFASRSQLQNHKSVCHLNAPLKAIQMVQSPEQDEIVPLISDIIAMGMTAELKALLPRCLNLISDPMLSTLARESEFCGKLEIFRYPWEQRNFQYMGVDQQSFIRSYASEAIMGKNIEVLEYLAPRIAVTDKDNSNDLRTYMRLGASSDSSRIFNIWKKQAREWNSDWLIKEWLVRFLTKPTIQERFADLLEAEASRGRFSPFQLSAVLKIIASTTCAPSIARILLKHGADVDYRTRKFSGRELIKTPLLAAASKTTKDAAELMKILLLVGADPNASYYQRTQKAFYHRRTKHSEPTFVGMEVGARQISKWLQISWTELVEWAAAKRSKNLQADDNRPVDS